MRILLVQHAECEREGFFLQLTEQGRRDARKTRKFIHDIFLNDMVSYTSTSTAATQTADENAEPSNFYDEYTGVGDFVDVISCVKYCIDSLKNSLVNNIVIYGHPVFFSTLISVISGVNPSSVGDLVFRFNYCSISTLEYDTRFRRWSVLKLNDTSHLSKNNISQFLEELTESKMLLISSVFALASIAAAVIINIS